MNTLIIRSMIFSQLKILFPGYVNILIYPDEKKAVVKFNDNSVKEFPTGETNQKYFSMLAEYKGIKEIKSIFVEPNKDVILVRGDKDVML